MPDFNSNLATLPMPAAPERISPRASTAAIDLHGVSKWYCRGPSKTVVFDGVDLKINAPECVFLLGPSGSGKTTLLSILGCVLTADEGEVRVLGRDLCRLDGPSAALLRRDHIGFVFQRFHLIRGLTSAENVAVPLVLRGWATADAARRATEMLDQVDLADFAATQPSRMSVGQCQRVALARALVGDPELVLADEPTASLDAEAGQQAMQLLRKLTTDVGKTLVVVTHDQRILPFADRVLHMANGRLSKAPVSTNHQPLACISQKAFTTEAAL